MKKQVFMAFVFLFSYSFAFSSEYILKENKRNTCINNQLKRDPLGILYTYVFVINKSECRRTKIINDAINITYDDIDTYSVIRLGEKERTDGLILSKTTPNSMPEVYIIDLQKNTFQATRMGGEYFIISSGDVK